MAMSAEDALNIKARLTAIEESNFAAKQERDNGLKQMTALSEQMKSIVGLHENARAQMSTNIDALDTAQDIDRTGLKEAVEQIKHLIVRMDKQAEDMKSLKESGTDFGSSSTRRSDRTLDLLSLKAVSLIPMYTGKPDDYINWTCKFRNVVASVSPMLRTLLKWIGEERFEPDDLRFDNGVEQLGMKEEDARDAMEQIYHLLLAKADGAALHLLQGYEDEEYGLRGVKSWWKLKQSAQGMSGNRMVGLYQRIGNPPRCGKVSELQAALDTWESMVREYESAEAKLPDSALVSGLVQLVPAELAQQMVVMGLDSFAMAKQYVERQIALRRETWFRTIPGTTSSNKTAPKDAMDIGAMSQDYETTELAVSDSRGETDEQVHVLGKGGQFQGYCDTCWKWGHKWRDCRSGMSKGGAHAGGKGKGYEPWAPMWPANKGKGKEQKGYRGDFKGQTKGSWKGKGASKGTG